MIPSSTPRPSSDRLRGVGSWPWVLLASAALLAFAHSFGLLCDDAFISFRYAQNWVEHGEITYNLGERVEGYTSFSWVALLACLNAMGVSLPVASKVLGAASAILLVLGLVRLCQRLAPERLAPCLTALALLSGNACVAAWTLGGLETPLDAALITASVVALMDWTDRASTRRGMLAAAALAAATLTRPEGLLLFLAAVVAVVAIAKSSRERPRQVPKGFFAFTSAYLVVMGAHVLWRYRYYGDLLPNTYYVKTTGAADALRERGLAYLAFCASELGWVFVLGLLLFTFLPAPRLGLGVYDGGRESAPHTGPFVARLCVSVFVASMLGYLVTIGGDFLDLYRFIVPLLPLVFAVAVTTAFDWLEWMLHALHLSGAKARWVLPIAGLALIGWYVPHQLALAHRSRQQSEPGRRVLGIEPLGWTATYSRRWAAMGRWLAAHREPGDVLAVGAAGAMPFYAKMPNIDTFGLNDRFIAHHGTIVGARPGHQRFAPLDYLLERHPTFLLINDYQTDAPVTLRNDPAWDRRGYVWVEAQLTPDAHQAPSTIYHYLLVRRDRAVSLRGADVRLDLGRNQPDFSGRTSSMGPSRR